jgi:hypothetical protein
MTRAIASAQPTNGLSVALPSRVLMAFAALHAAMFAYDLAHPDRFLRADRATERLQSIEGFAQALHAGDALAYLTSRGVAGDWLPQALLYLAGGQYLVIAAQVALLLASIAWVRDIGLRAGLRAGHAAAAALLYALLPHSLVLPHQLASEAVFVPLIVLAFRLSLPGLAPSGGAALGLATLVRPVTLLWPPIQAAFDGGSPRRRIAFVAVSLAPLLAWMSFVFVVTGEFSMGRSGHDLGSNLYARMQRMAVNLPPAERPAVKPPGQKQVSVGEYLRFSLAHPGAAALHGARDVVTVALKSGIERVTLDYLDLFPDSRRALQDPGSGWRADLEDEGAARTFLRLLRDRPGLVLSSAAGSLLFALFVGLAAIGALGAARGPRRNRALLLLAGFVVYIGITAQAVDAAQSRHRAPAEFALCVLALAGWAARQRS